jgi:predicted NodU family carbamoyl transferase
MKILGLNYFGHDSSVALAIDGKVISAVEEERFSRIKHDSAFPELSINYCLKNSNLNLSEIDVVALSFIPEKWIQGGVWLIRKPTSQIPSLFCNPKLNFYNYAWILRVMLENSLSMMGRSFLSDITSVTLRAVIISRGFPIPR